MLHDDQESDILERLAHPEREHERRRPDRLFFIRNIFNGIFILLAAVAMVGIVVTRLKGWNTDWCYALGLVAVLVKMGEALLRMPSLLKKPRKPGERL